MSDCYWGVHWYGLQIACKMARHLRLHSQYWNFFAVIAYHCFPQSCVQIYIWQLWRPCHTHANDLRHGYVLSWSLFSVWCSCRQICINNNISKAMSDTNLSLSIPGMSHVLNLVWRFWVQLCANLQKLSYTSQLTYALDKLCPWANLMDHIPMNW